MDIERNKKTARRLYELLNHGDAAAIGDLVSPDYEEHDPLPGQGTGREGAIDRFSMIITGLAPHFTIEDVVAEDDRVVVRWTNEGTHIGEFTGVPPTGRAFQYRRHRHLPRRGRRAARALAPARPAVDARPTGPAADRRLEGCGTTPSPRPAG